MRTGHLPTVRKRRKRFADLRLNGLTDEHRPGSPRFVTDAQVEQAFTLTLKFESDGATHRSTRGLARTLGRFQTAVSRIWRAFGPKPHLRETFEFSTVPCFAEKVRDVVGLYMAPPPKAIVLLVTDF